MVKKPFLPFDTKVSFEEDLTSIEVGYLDELAKLFDFPSPETIDEWNVDYVNEMGNNAYAYVMESRWLSKEEAEEEAEVSRLQAEEQAQTEVYIKYKTAMEDAADSVLREFGLWTEWITKTNSNGDPEQKIYIVANYDTKTGKPIWRWQKAALKIYSVISGMGYDNWDTFSEFIDQYREDDDEEEDEYYYKLAVEDNMNYFKHYSTVYGTASAKSLFSQYMR